MLRIITCAGMLLVLANGFADLADAAPQPKAPMTESQSPAPHTNQLAQEKSPYLLQHSHNPVDWYPWEEQAFRRAREENKPIFLSIGYSTCHWCHVMERESFEDEKVGAFLNQHFISIKVDREERPDVDKIYMTFVQATTGSGGWPMSVFLTPELKPFYGGTYFPPQPSHGRPSFMQVLDQVAEVWQTKQDQVRSNANQIHAQLAEALQSEPTSQTNEFDADLIRRTGQGLKQMYDPQYGGFGGSPKFPQPSQPELLLRYAQRFGDAEATQMVLKTCDRMAAGGIYDQLGGGFSRYSVDAEWLVPHFEKMLYDNAQLLELYLHACLMSGDPRYAQTARGIIAYALRDMRHAGGGFYSAEDADSEGQEGKFYCWTEAELKELLNPEEFKVVVRYYGITQHGNFVDHSHPNPLPNLNVLSIVNPDLTAEEQEKLTAANAKMLEVRSRRVRPHLDDKILTSWNGLMLGALAQASAILEDTAYLQAAETNLAFIQQELWDPKNKTLHHRWRDGERDSVQLLEDYAFLLEGVLELYEVSLKTEYLDFSIQLADRMLALFYDAQNGGFWQSAADDPNLIFRIKEDHDGAEPSGNSVATQALLRLATITDRSEFREAAMKTLAFFEARLSKTPQALPRMLQAVDFTLQEPTRVVISGDPDSQQVKAMLQATHSVYQPHKVVLGTAEPVESFARTLAGKDAQVYLCTGTACQPPTNEPEHIREMLK